MQKKRKSTFLSGRVMCPFCRSPLPRPGPATAPASVDVQQLAVVDVGLQAADRGRDVPRAGPGAAVVLPQQRRSDDDLYGNFLNVGRLLSVLNFVFVGRAAASAAASRERQVQPVQAAVALGAGTFLIVDGH